MFQCLVVLVVSITWVVVISLPVDMDLDAVPHSRMKRQADESCYIADIVFVLDSSGSIKLNNWNKVLNFTKGIVNAFNVGPQNVRIGVNFYGNEADVAFHLNTYNTSEDILAAIDEITWKDQETNTSGGIRAMYRDMFTEVRGDRFDAPNVGIIITDGESNRDANLTIPEANIAKQRDIIMFAIGIGDSVSEDELVGIADEPSEDFKFNADSFDALEGIQKEVVVAACQAASDCAENGDWVVIMDSSGSVGPAHFNITKNFVRDLILDTNIDNGLARVGLMTYNDNAEIRWDLNTFTTRASAVEELDRITFSPGRTNTAEALRRAREEMFTSTSGDRDEYRNTIILFTDGGSNEFQETLVEARKTRLAGITMVVVAVSGWVNTWEVNEIATDPDRLNVLHVSNYDAIHDIYQPLKRAVCNEPNECYSNPCRNRGTCINMANYFECLCPDGYAGINCEIRCVDPQDVAIVVDSSTSMGEQGHYEIMNFVKDIVRSLPTGPRGRTRVGLQVYSDTPNIQFHMNEYENKTDLVNAITYAYHRGKTDSAAALRYTREEMFSLANGARAEFPNIVIFISDGESADREATFFEASETHAAGLQVFAVGTDVKGIYSTRELLGINSDPDDANYMESRAPDGLTSLTSNLITNICNDRDECDDDPCQNGGTCVDGYNTYQCRCPQDFTGLHCEKHCSGAADIAFVIDSSGSVRESRFEMILDFVNNVTETLEMWNDNVRAGVVTFADNAVMRIPLRKYRMKEDMMHATKNIKYTYGKTNTADAMRLVRDEMFLLANGDRPNVPNFIVIITDGMSTMNPDMTLPEAIATRVAGIHIIVISIENDVNNLEIKGMASKPTQYNVYPVETYGDVAGLLNNISYSFCDDYDECHSSPCQSGGQCIPAMNQYLCACQDIFTGYNCERQCSRTLDVAFVLDGSGSVARRFELAQELTERIVMGLNFHGSRTRVAVVTFQDAAKIEFPLNKYNEQLEVVNAIAFKQDASRIGTNTADAIDLARDDVFTPTGGDRPGVDNVLIVMSDGQSNMNPGRTELAAEDARNAGIRVLGVGMGISMDMGEINEIADDPDSENAFFLSDELELQNVADLILDQLCQ